MPIKKPLNSSENIKKLDPNKLKLPLELEILEKLPVSTFIVQDNLIYYANPAACQMSGFSKPEMIGQLYTSFLLPESVVQIADKITRRAKGEDIPIRYDIKAKHKSGNIMWLNIGGTPINYYGSTAILVTWIDISIQKRTEEALIANEKQTRTITDNIPMFISKFDSNMKLLFINRAYEEYYKIDRADYIGKNINEFHSIDLLNKIDPHIKKCLQGKSSSYCSERINQKGENRYYHSHLVPEFDSKKNVISVYVVTSDITEIKQTAAALQRSETKLRKITDSAPVMINYIDKDYRYQFVNKAYQQLIGLPFDKIINKTPKDLFSTEEYNKVKHLRDQLVTGKTIEYDGLYITPAGKKLYYSSITAPDFNEKNEILGYYQVITDITKHIEFQNELIRSQAISDKTQKLASIGFFEYDINTKEAYWSKELYRITGFDPSKPPPTRNYYKRMIHPDDQQYVLNEQLKHQRNSEAYTLEYRYCLPNNQIKYFKSQVEPVLDDNGILLKYFGSIQDITTLRQTEARLKESETRLLKSQDIARVGNFEVDLVNNSYYWSDSLFDIFEIDNQVKPPNLESLIERIHPDDRDKFISIHQNFFHQNQTNTLEFRIILLSGDIRYIHSTIDPVFNNLGRVIRIFGTIQDTTSLREVELKLLDSEERYRDIFQNAPIGIFQASIDGKILHANDQLARIFGFENSQELLSITQDKNIADLVYKKPEKREKIIDLLQKTSNWYQTEIEYKRKDGSPFTGFLTVRLVKKTGKTKIVEGFIEDISLRKEVETRIQTSEAKYRNIFLAAKDAIILTYGDKGKIIDVNQAACDIYGYSREELLKLTILDLSANPNLTAFALKSKAELVPLRFHKKKDGSLFAVEVSASYFKMPNYQVEHSILVIKDISDRKKTEDALRTSEELHRKLIASLPDGVILLDINFNITYATPKLLEIFEFNPDDNVIGRNALDWLIPEEHELAKENLKKIIANETREIKLFHILKKNGEMLIADVNGSIITDKQGNPSQILLVIHSLTDRIKAEKDLFESNERFRVIFNMSPAGIVLINPFTGIIEQSNNTFSEITGYSTIELSGFTFRDLTHPDDIAIEADLSEKVKNNEAHNYSLEKRFIKKSGETIWVQLSVSVVSDKNNQIAYAIAIVNDITALKNLQKELMDKEAKYRHMVENINEVIWEIDLKENISYISPRVTDLFGYQPEHLINQNYNLLLSPSETQRVQQSLEEVIKNRKPYKHFEMQFSHKDGSIIWSESSANPIFDDEGNFCGYRGVTKDITESKLSQIELLQREKYLTAIAKLQYLLLQPWKEHVSVDTALAILGEVTSASRSYIYSIHSDSDNNIFVILENEWCAPGIKPYINNEEKMKLYIKHDSVLANFLDPQWQVNDVVSNLPEVDRIALEKLDVKSILLLPLSINNKNEGFIGFDECFNEKIFNDSEISLLKTTAGALSLAYDRFRTNQELILKENHLRAMLENIPVVLWTTDLDGKYTFIEGKLTKKGPIDPEKYLGFNVYEKSKEMHHPPIKTVAITEALQGNGFEYFIEHENHHYHIIVSPLFDKPNNQTGVIGVTIDITDQYKTQEALQQSENKYRMLVETINDGIMVVDENRIIVYANKQFSNLIGKGDTNLVGLIRNSLLVDQSDEIKNMQVEMRKRRQKGITDTYNMPFKLPDGKIRWLRVSATPIMVDGVYKGGLSLFHDFTELKEAEITQKELSKSIESAMAEIKTLSGLIPICSYCKKIRDDSGYWSQIEAYMAKHSEAHFSHGICPECYKTLLSEIEDPKRIKPHTDEKSQSDT